MLSFESKFDYFRWYFYVRFPNDVQNCSIELVFTDYNGSEVKWEVFDWSYDFDEDVNPGWTRVDEYSKVDEVVMKKAMGRKEAEYQSLSVFNYTITVRRVPRTAFVYIIMPTLAITLFNLISLVLPSGEGMQNFCFL